ncbi:MAG TPA: 3-deoxy-7-phosphoheptulonate synthase, partial [Spirochaetia bacterium]|nr:3-deoxy-7-phosphoheptulonate synthase [Spirochaetia bacterium]
MSNTNTHWTPESWTPLAARHQPSYDDLEGYRRALDQLRSLPPIVFPGEVDQLRGQIADAAAGRQFILHGGDCVERFIDCNPRTITNKLKILLQMSVILSHAARKPVLRIGRIAGQYFKPRSLEIEQIGSRSIPTYKGDTINGIDPDDRQPDPGRLVQGYFHATATLNYIRSMIDGGFADLHHPYSWNLHSIEQTAKWDEYRSIVDNILDAIHFMESFGGIHSESLGRIDFYTSHEGLHLGYESALSRPAAISRSAAERYYDTSAHLLWIGERTRALDGAHVEFFRGIANPIGVKLSASADPREVVELTRVLNPENDAGRLMLITRLGADRVHAALPRLVEAVEGAGRRVAWMCDPMHGNTT